MATHLKQNGYSLKKLKQIILFVLRYSLSLHHKPKNTIAYVQNFNQEKQRQEGV